MINQRSAGHRTPPGDGGSGARSPRAARPANPSRRCAEMSSVGDGDPVTAVRRLLTEAGIVGRRVRMVVARLLDEPHTLASLVTASGVDRRTVEAVLAAA